MVERHQSAVRMDLHSWKYTWMTSMQKPPTRGKGRKGKGRKIYVTLPNNTLDSKTQTPWDSYNNNNISTVLSLFMTIPI